MKKEKYYYGEDLRRGLMGVILDSQNKVVKQCTIYAAVPLSRVTICGIYDNVEKTMSYGVAKCCENDAFIRKIGRKIAYSRALNKPYRVVHIQPEDKISELFITHAKNIEQEVLKDYNKKA